MPQVMLYTNAFMELMLRNARILCDPWLTPGAFDGSWWQFPPLKTQPENLTNYTHLYISHIHTDHCDLASLKRLPNKNIPVIILKREREVFLRRRIESCGFRNFIQIPAGSTMGIGNGVFVTMYGAFSDNVFIDSAETPNVIDSSIVVSSPDGSIFNANDNVPTPEICRQIRERHGVMNIAMLPYCGVGPFPSSYMNLSEEQKLIHAKRKATKYLRQLVENAGALGAKMVIPCAGQMILGGKQAHKNATVGCAESEEAERVLRDAGQPCVLLWEGDVFDSQTGLVTRGNIGPNPNGLTKAAYIEQIKDARYWWEDAFQVPPEQMVDPTYLLNVARKRLAFYQKERYKYAPAANEWTVAIEVEEIPDKFFVFSFDPDRGNESLVRKVDKEEFMKTCPKFLLARLPYAYLTAILTTHCHWNNGYHGCHIEWLRQPDRGPQDFIPDIQTLLSYFHF